MSDLTDKLAKLRSWISSAGKVVVAFSGGVDSALLAWVANDVLGSDAIIVTAVSASLASAELEDCRAMAGEWGLHYLEVATDEGSRPGYVANGSDRCWHCKSALMDGLRPIAMVEGATVVLGVNCDDLDDHRPGQAAASEGGALFPLVEAGLTKADVRDLARSLGLRVWDKPSAACLSSRVPYGTAVTLGVLKEVGEAEAALRSLGFRQLRVRHYGELARIELDEADMSRVIQLRQAIVAAVRSAGYRYVTLDLEGFRSGNLNGSLDPGLLENSRGKGKSFDLQPQVG